MLKTLFIEAAMVIDAVAGGVELTETAPVAPLDASWRGMLGLDVVGLAVGLVGVVVVVLVWLLRESVAVRPLAHAWPLGEDAFFSVSLLLLSDESVSLELDGDDLVWKLADELRWERNILASLFDDDDDEEEEHEEEFDDDEEYVDLDLDDELFVGVALIRLADLAGVDRDAAASMSLRRFFSWMVDALVVEAVFLASSGGLELLKKLQNSVLLILGASF